MEAAVTNEPIVTIVKSAILHVENLREAAEWYANLLKMPLRPFDDNVPFYEFDMDNRANLNRRQKRRGEGNGVQPPVPECLGTDFSLK
ncbi:hypothetical protein [Cohnella thermotolerans]|uniref:hypothetical protein n=1 Tax=Cohnella thermotolerans TaxID=329858 RepID=UPI0003FE48F1|nr:hypothetical protein [Cohnella thermotolerans]